MKKFIIALLFIGLHLSAFADFEETVVSEEAVVSEEEEATDNSDTDESESDLDVEADDSEYE